MTLPVDGAHEVLGVGVLAPDSSGYPRLHMHAALGRSGHTLSGDIRNGVDVWLVGEAIIYEIKGAAARRVKHSDIKLSLLEMEPDD
jgi:predicted DNA-binding protein with PD1-like motif